MGPVVHDLAVIVPDAAAADEVQRRVSQSTRMYSANSFAPGRTNHALAEHDLVLLPGGPMDIRAGVKRRDAEWSPGAGSDNRASGYHPP